MISLLKIYEASDTIDTIDMLDLEVTSTKITTATRKLKARWTPDLKLDLGSAFNIKIPRYDLEFVNFDIITTKIEKLGDSAYKEDIIAAIKDYCKDDYDEFHIYNILKEIGYIVEKEELQNG